MVLRCAIVFAACGFVQWSSPAAVTLQTGRNFIGAAYGTDSTYEPPDAGLAVGPSHIVEFVNGRFLVLNKLTGARVQNRTDVSFWGNAGVSAATVSDPRVVFDADSQRWFVAQVDVPSSGANRFLLAVSATDDPTAAWNALAWTADPTNGYFADFPTLGIDAAGVYLGADMFSGNNSVGSLLHVLPKQDLLANPPSIAGLNVSSLLDFGAFGEILQPAVAIGPASSGGAVLAIADLGYDLQPHSTLLSLSVQDAGAPAAATLGIPVPLSIPPYLVPINPPQPGGVDNLDDGDARISATVYRVGDRLYAAHGVQVDNRAAIQWFVVDATSQTLVDTGTLTDPILNLFYPSICANPGGTVVIAYNACGTNMFISSFAVAGEPLNGSLSFGNPVLLKAGTAAYRTNNASTLSRWGDYSAISPDPSDPTRFWALTEYPSTSTAWSTAITELITGPLTLAMSNLGTNVQISWSASVAGYQLQSSPTLAPAQWEVVPKTPVLAGRMLSVSIEASNAAAFFQLVR